MLHSLSTTKGQEKGTINVARAANENSFPETPLMLPIQRQNHYSNDSAAYFGMSQRTFEELGAPLNYEMGRFKAGTVRAYL